jgi:hypothetical protein
LGDDDPIPAPIDKIFEQSVPKFKTQTHFYGYDGRGSDPTRFDCIYTYNLGQTVFSLIANGATGQMAAILNLEQDFSGWRPIGIPIAPLMHIEERKGKLELVLEKSIVDVNSPAFRVVEALSRPMVGRHPGRRPLPPPGPHPVCRQQRGEPPHHAAAQRHGGAPFDSRREYGRVDINSQSVLKNYCAWPSGGNCNKILSTVFCMAASASCGVLKVFNRYTPTPRQSNAPVSTA